MSQLIVSRISLTYIFKNYLEAGRKYYLKGNFFFTVYQLLSNRKLVFYSTTHINNKSVLELKASISFRIMKMNKHLQNVLTHEIEQDSMFCY